MSSDSDSDSEGESALVGSLPEQIGYLAANGDFGPPKAWLAGLAPDGSTVAPRSVNSLDTTGWTLLMCTATSDFTTQAHVEFARYLIARGAKLDIQSAGTRCTALHFACGRRNEAGAALVSVLVDKGANVNLQSTWGETPLFMIEQASESTLDIVTTLLRAGASLDYEDRGSIWSFEEHLDGLEDDDPDQHFLAVRTLVASVRAAGSWKAHCRLAHKEVLRLRSLVARGRVKLPRRRSPRGRDVRQERALEFVLRQGDNGIVWNILSFWRETA